MPFLDVFGFGSGHCLLFQQNIPSILLLMSLIVLIDIEDDAMLPLPSSSLQRLDQAPPFLACRIVLC
jgi:hypothetical protein